MSLGVMKLFGGAAIAYTYAVEDTLNENQQKLIRTSTKAPEWDRNTQFSIAFNNGLVAGNASSGSNPPTEWSIYRQKIGDPNLYLAATLSGDKRSFVDYAVHDGAEYKYYIYPNGASIIGSPIETDEVITEWGYWALFVVDPTGIDNMYELNSYYLFEFNVEDVSVQANTEYNVLTNFTKYPKVQHNNDIAMNVTLTSLLGGYDCEHGEFVDDVKCFDELVALSATTKKLFLRDPDGHFIEVRMNAPVTITRQNGIHTKSVSLIQVNDATNTMVVGYNE